jgi:hypothetical protein
MAVYSVGSMIVPVDDRFCLRKKCPHINNYSLFDVFPEEMVRLSYATHSCIDCTALIGDCRECKKVFAEKTLKKYEGRCGKCWKNRQERRLARAIS